MPFYEWDETINGKVIPKRCDPTNHSAVKGNLICLFGDYLDGQETEYFSGAGLFIMDGEIYMPDGALVSNPQQVREDGIHGTPDLVIEILSYRTARYDRGRKKDVYEQCGVPEYWIITPDDRSIERYLLRDGKFVLQDMYYQFSDDILEFLDPDEREEIVTEFHCVSLPGLLVRVEDVFDGVRDWG